MQLRRAGAWVVMRLRKLAKIGAICGGHTKTRLAALWRNGNINVVNLLLIVMAGLCGWFYLRPPEAGWAIAALGGAAAIIALWPPSVRQKSLFAALTTALVFIELQAIHRGGQELKDGFDKSLKHLKENLNNVTGADAFPYIVPQPAFGDNIPLVIWNAGEYPLTGVTVTILPKSVFTNGTGEFGGEEIDVGVLPPHGHRSLKQLIKPTPDETGEDVYIMEISAQNGRVGEILKFRKGKGSLPWAYMYNATKESSEFGPKTPSKIPNIDLQSTSSGVWSDDPQFGKTPPALTNLP